MEPNAGRKLGRYTLEDKLGSGATADVFRAIQSGVERPVAIKVMHPHLAQSADFSARFLREAQALGKLQHPHVGRVIDFEPDGDHPYMVLEFLAGGSLRDVMDASATRLPIDYGISVARQVADGLAYAHGLGMVHRDLKPANVMFVDREARHAVLTDFGMARLTDEKLTMSGTMLGTPAYMAPEQVLGQTAGPAADQYSLGVMLFELVTGRLPFTADNIHALMIKHTGEPVPSVRALNPQVSPELESIIVRAMAKEPADRFPDAGALRDALDRLETGVSASMRSATIVAPTVDPKLTVAAQPVAAPPTNGTKDVSAAADSGAASKPRTAAGSGPSRVKLAAAALGVAAVAGVAAFGLTRGGADTPTDEEPAVAAAVVPETSSAVPADDEPADESEAESTEPDAPVADAAPQADDPQVMSIASSEVRGNRLLLAFDQVRQPAAGAQYVAWLDNVSGPVGVLVLDASGRAVLDVQVDNLRQARELQISEESVEAVDGLTVPSGSIVFARAADPAAAAALTELAGVLLEARTEMDIALEHDAILRDEIAAGNPVEIRRHAEHVVNILDGAEGENFGDHDGDGVAQNPGNGVGVRGYALAVGDLAPRAALFDTILAELAAELGERSVAAQPSYRDLAAAVAVDDVNVQGAGQLLVTADETLQQLDRSLERELALLLTRDPSVSLADDLGSVTLGPGGTELIVQRGPALHRPGLGVLELRIGDPSAPSGSGELDDFGTARAPVGLANLASLGEVGLAPVDTTGYAAVAVLPPEAIEAVVRLIGGPDALVSLLSAEAQIASEHALFMQGDIEVGDHAGARRHAEHTVNIIEGEEGEHFGDLDGDGTPQNPGSGVGVLPYLNDIEAVVEAMPTTAAHQQRSQRRLLDAIGQIRANATATVDAALRVISTDTADEAAPIVEDVYNAVALVMDGHDLDGNGVVDPMAAEIGVRRLTAEVPTLVAAPLQRVG